MILKFIDTEDLENVMLGDEDCICFVKADMDKYDLNFIQEWIMSLADKMPNVQWCILPHGIDLEFFCKEDALKYLDWVKEKINER